MSTTVIQRVNARVYFAGDACPNPDFYTGSARAIARWFFEEEHPEGDYTDGVVHLVEGNVHDQLNGRLVYAYYRPLSPESRRYTRWGRDVIIEWI